MVKLGGRLGDGLRQGLGQHGLARTGVVLQQDVTSGDEGGDHELDFLRLAADDAFDVGRQGLEFGVGSAHGVVVSGSVDTGF